MSVRIDLKANPFYLSDEAIAWVEETLASMSLNDKLGQLFCPGAMGDLDTLLADMDRCGMKPGAILFRKSSAEVLRGKIKKTQDRYEIPLLIAADLDRGASNVIEEGTPNGHHMQIAATGDPNLAYRAALLCARQCMATGTNWDFGPVTDIDFNPYSPIVNVRSFGSNPETVAEFSSQYARGLKDGGDRMQRVRADHMGMLATAINALALQDAFEGLGKKAAVLSAVDMDRFCDSFSSRKAKELLSQKVIVIFACGSGCPFFSTDTAAALRAAEIGADALLLAKNVDAVYSADPKKDPNAVRYSHLSYEKVIRDNLKATDLTAITLCREQELPILCFALDRLEEAVECENVGTLIDSRP